jgi:hypothetical protein
MGSNVTNFGEDICYELFRVHWFQVMECPVGLLDLWIAICTTE